MKQEKILMGMTIKIEIADQEAGEKIFDKIFSYFKKVDKKFSTYKNGSEISKINSKILKENEYSSDMAEIFELAEKTKKETGGYFDIKTPAGTLDPSGIVKGWAIHKAGEILKENGFKNFYIDAGGDIEAVGKNKDNEPWRIGIRNPLSIGEIIKVLSVENRGVATSGSYVHGDHIYNPHGTTSEEIVSLTVIGPNIYEADRFATAAFAMGENGIFFIDSVPELEGYAVYKNGQATATRGFQDYVLKK